LSWKRISETDSGAIPDASTKSFNEVSTMGAN